MQSKGLNEILIVILRGGKNINSNLTNFYFPKIFMSKLLQQREFCNLI